MEKILTTFSGKYGDILWSLVTVRQISRMFNCKVDFACMPEYRGLIPLIQQQEYIAKAFVIENWICEGSPCGDQPWKSPSQPGYDYTFDLTYRFHPNQHVRLAYAIASTNAIQLTEPIVPWLDVNVLKVRGAPVIAYAFNAMYAQQKTAFLFDVQRGLPNAIFYDVGTSDVPWVSAAAVIKTAIAFVGCRSAHHVLAHGLGARVVIYEPEPARNWTTFKSPWGQEVQVLSALDAIRALGVYTAANGATA
jgi:hypothetical protein